MSCPKITTRIDDAEWERLKEEAKAKAGVDVSTDSGEYAAQSFRVSWEYNPDSEVLTIQVLDHPALVNCDFINSMIMHGISDL